MKKYILRNTLVIGIVILFVGAVVVPSISSVNNLYEVEDNPLKSSSFDPYAEGWGYRKTITIDHDMVTGNLNYFPVLISTTDDDLSDKAQSDGDDILFMDDDGEADQLYHEIEYYDDSNGELVAWVNIPGLSATVDTVLYMYYGNPDCGSQEYPDAVWDSDYIHVWHLGDSLEDSAGSDDGTNHGTNTVYGKIGEARDFENDDHDFIDFGDMAQPGDGSLTTMTWEAWVKPETQDMILMTKYNTQGTDYTSYYLLFTTGGKFRIGAASAFGVGTSGRTDDSYSVVGEWIYLTATYTLGGTNEIGAFINGDEVAFTHESQSANVMKNIPVTDDLGRYRPEQSTKYADAVFDEVRWSKVVRSDDWIKTSFNNMDGPSSFLSFSAEEGNEPPNTPGSPDPDDNEVDVSINADLSWLCNDPDGDDIVYDVFFEAEDSTPDILVSNDQAENTYDPGTMELGTTYYWRIIAKDEHDATTEGPVWSFTTRTNNSPSTPIINGPVEGKPEVSYTYTFKSTDPEDDDLHYYIDWGDTTYEDWFGPFGSGEEIEKTHVFENEGTYIIYAKARDAFGSESDWGTLTVTIPRDKVLNRPILQFLQNHPNMFPLLQRLLQHFGL
jgi:hypothetical protein